MRHPIFDFDGTILNSLTGGPALFLKVAESMSLDRDSRKEQELRARWGLPVGTLISECWPTGDPPAFFQMLKIVEAENLHPLFPMMDDLLLTLGKDRGGQYFDVTPTGKYGNASPASWD